MEINPPVSCTLLLSSFHLSLVYSFIPLVLACLSIGEKENLSATKVPVTHLSFRCLRNMKMSAPLPTTPVTKIPANTQGTR